MFRVRVYRMTRSIFEFDSSSQKRLDVTSRKIRPVVMGA
jgi:hypothetical protein